ncbi:hypothetical protein CHGG_07467 [Chaetomium globosum CBS 148.51]|uniref:DUF1996 domain-containing protein n=1 Tax=Chaetomium globosum (strain ATCC 6205 / CBS 148.51 / DSM 1962 / NBRC 6347 / NRRL 1970) TaxID=306901 RepID=Q2GX37_CHAGB|nr:uncharacterized protein CHGG_07467 [Chaetomium globosum CBS 148.51]EAQ86214.1 hypothetical protein CHGG_07467 [Chaetomium globosum CBS 148.51]
MHMNSLAALALVAPASALLRFGCSQLVVERLDPLTNPSDQDAFNVTMDPESGDIAEKATCTTCQFSEDFSNYWTAVLFFKARNGTYQRVPQIPNVGFEGQTGGMTVYYMQDGLANYEQTSKVTAFKTGFRMLVGEASYRSKEQANRFRQITYTCLQNPGTRFPESMDFPKEPCPAGIMANVRFPTCWDGKNLDSPDHMSHMSYPELGTFESGGPCPESHPGDSLQRAMDSPCYVNCPTLKTQSVSEMNKCSVPNTVDEDFSGWLKALPGAPTGVTNVRSKMAAACADPTEALKSARAPKTPTMTSLRMSAAPGGQESEVGKTVGISDGNPR